MPSVAIYGYVTTAPAAGQYGAIVSQYDDYYRFMAEDYDGPPPDPPAAVLFEPSTQLGGHLRARRVRPADVGWQAGDVAREDKSGVVIRLTAGRVVYAQRGSIRPGTDTAPGTRVRFRAVLGKLPGRLFALEVEPATRRAAVAARTQMGTRTGKSVNDDSYLVYQVPGTDTWLVAVADGVSRPGEGWWASDRCVGLLWETVARYTDRLADGPADPPAVMREWITEVHGQFARRRRAAPAYLAANSTLTFAVVTGPHVYYAHCGDTRLYVFDPAARGTGFVAVLDDKDLRRMKNTSGHLVVHVGCSDKAWDPACGQATIPAGGLLAVCSDGVIGGAEAGKKFAVMRQELVGRGDLQERVEAAVNKIADTGEDDDLTLVVIQPGGS